MVGAFKMYGGQFVVPFFLVDAGDVTVQFDLAKLVAFDIGINGQCLKIIVQRGIIFVFVFMNQADVT